MTPPRGTAAGLSAWTVCLLAAARPVPLPPEVKAAAALAAVLFLPGWALAGRLPGLPGGWPARWALAVPLSLGLLAVTASGGRLLGVPILPVAAAHLFVAFLLLLAPRRASAPAAAGGSPGFAVLLAGALAAAAALGAMRGPGTDGPDHVTTVNEIVLAGDLAPRQGLTADGEVDRADPRKGLFHVALAAAAVISDRAAREVWQAAPPVLAASWVPLVFVLGARFGGGAAAGAIAAGLAFLFLGGSQGAWAPRSGYGAHVGLLLAWAMLWVWRAGQGRAARWLLAGLAATATLVHPMAAGLFAAPAAVWVAVARREDRRALLPGLIAVLAGALPALVHRALEAQGPRNPLHALTMPVLELAPGWDVLWPGEVWRLLGAGLLGLPALALLSRAGGRDHRYLAAATLTPLAVALVPGLFGLTAAVASSFPVKLLYTVPFFWVLGAVLARGWSRRGWIPRAALAGLLLAAVPATAARFDRGIRDAGRPAAAEAILQALRAHPGRVVVAADPWLSSLIAAETPHFPVTVLHQHGHPLDPRGLDRLDDLGLMLSPWVAPRRSLELLREYRVSHVAVAAVPAPERGFGCARGGAVDGSRLAAFAPGRGPFVERVPGLVFVDGDRADRAAPDPLLAPPPAPASWTPVSAADGSAGGVRLLGVSLPESLRTGETAPMTLLWKRDPDASGWPVLAHVRLTSLDDPPPAKWRRWLGRRWGGRARVAYAPFAGAWPAAGWAPGDTLADVQDLVDPLGLEPGRYAVSVRVLPDALFPRIGLRDLVSDRDRWQGEAVGEVRIVP